MTDNPKPTIGEVRRVEDLPLIVTHSETRTINGNLKWNSVEAEKTCATCRLWQGHPWINEGVEWNRCQLPQIYRNGRETILGATGARKHTAFDHSCAGWQQRGGE